MAKNKLGFVNGECICPNDPALTAQWDRCNGMVIAWLLHSVDRDIAESIIYCPTAADMCWCRKKSRGKCAVIPKLPHRQLHFTLTNHLHMYYCDHCKVPGNSTQRCYKLHGNLNGRMAVQAGDKSIGDAQLDKLSNLLKHKLINLLAFSTIFLSSLLQMVKAQVPCTNGR
ncbi:hypothetical protein LIER_20676 [Lithospermum erythrorhizon]|uniref:Uncharacterized protein n=1 Tax=Lithospermum erythrorhizon TaxID=34254 RepID=A0AAV3QMC3_LITER